MPAAGTLLTERKPWSLLELNRKLSHKARKGSDRHAREQARKAQQRAEQSHKRAEKAVRDAKAAQKRANSNLKSIKHVNTRLDVAHTRTNEIIKTLDLQHKRANEIMKKVDLSDTKAAEVHAMSSGQIDKLKRMWAEEDIRIKYYKLRKHREKADRKANQDFCAREKDERITVFSAVPLKTEVDHLSCINRNRDELIQAFCNFRQDFDIVLREAGLKTGTYFWPNICCKSWDDESKKDPCKVEGVPRELVVPFAGSQGGKVTFSNLYGEVKDVLEKQGYLHEGMIKVLREAKINLARGKEVGVTLGDIDEVGKMINRTFDDVSLCGPRIFRDPRKEEETMCEIFYPYEHLLKLFSDVFKKESRTRKLNKNKKYNLRKVLKQMRKAWRGARTKKLKENEKHFKKMRKTRRVSKKKKATSRKKNIFKKMRKTRRVSKKKKATSRKKNIFKKMRKTRRVSKKKKATSRKKNIFKKMRKTRRVSKKKKATSRSSFIQLVASRQRNFNAQQPMTGTLQRKTNHFTGNAASNEDTKTEIAKQVEHRLFGRLQSWIVSFVRSDPELRGPAGEKGDKGDPGEDGRDGEKGDKGDPGEDGRDGEKGDKGDPGKDGQDGDKGDPGKDGRDGEKGDKGDRGKDGLEKDKKMPSLEVINALKKRSTVAKYEVRQTKVDALLSSKATRRYSRSTCPKVTGVNPLSLDKYKKKFCPLYKHIDLREDVANIAMVYMQDDIPNMDIVAELRKEARFIVEDGCSTPLFTASDISLQKIKVNETEKNWVAFVHLDSTSKEGYLQSELANCKYLNYVPQTSVKEIVVEEPTWFFLSGAG
eukprot:g3074.t1